MMKVVLPAVVCLLLIVGLATIAHAKSGKAKGQCPSDTEEGVQSGSSLMVEATSTGSIYSKPVLFRQNFDEECHTEEAREYRTADGSCNHVFNYGSANTPFKRLLPPVYEDTINSPRHYGEDSNPLPSPTDISREVLPHKNVSSNRTTMYMQWGQFVDHDITLTPVPTKLEGTIKCCGPNATFTGRSANPLCFPIKLGPEDANIRFRGNCMEFVRSLPAGRRNGRQIVPREQVNELTAFIDGSMIYGNTEELQKELRETGNNGTPGAKMRTSENNLLPENKDTMCINGSEDFCFLAGDERVNVQPGLIVMHTMWVRLHNLIVDGLRQHRPGDTEEELFQEARKIIIGILQNIHFNEWLPMVIGTKMHEEYNLYPDTRYGKRTGYSAHLDPRIVNAFATAAFRFGHSLIPQHLIVRGQAYRFHDLFFRPALIFKDFDGVVLSLLNTSHESSAQKADSHMVDDITNHLFEPPNQEEGAPSHGLDIAALNIQRGRDHGLPPFNKFRKICGLPPIKNFTEFGDVAQDLTLLYSSVDDLDLFVGGLLEAPVDGADVGPTFACIIAQQFFALKFGDRFYFETHRMPEGFTDDQLQEIRNMTLAHVSCLTTNITAVQENVFIAGGEILDCDTLKNSFLEFSLWNRTHPH